MNPETIEHTTMLDAARAYAERGWAVFPLAAGTKQPMAGSRGFKDASRDIEQITAWWSAAPDANIGVPTGAINDITVFDVDMNPAKGKQGAATLLTLVQEHGALPPTLRQKTWSGGVQYIFAYNPNVPSRARIGGLLDIDTRNDGGYVVVPPSRVSEGTQHGTYAWTADLNTPRATMPDWLLERIIQTTPAAAQRGHRNPPG